MKREQNVRKQASTAGITLIALIITIIVLMILASITIGMLTADNSVIEQTKNAKVNTEQARLQEEVHLATYSKEMDEGKSLETYLNKIEGATVEKVASDAYYVTRGNSEVTVYDDGDVLEGKVEIWDGTSSESPKFKDWNWYIYTPSQLKFLADFVNNGNTFAEGQEALVVREGYKASDVKMEETTKVYLMNNLDLGARPGNGTTEEEKWETGVNNAKKWIPIGIGDKNTPSKWFIGTFEGNSHSIKGVYVNQTENFGGIFGNSNTIQNLTIKDSYIKGGSATGGIIGALRGTGKIENCHNKNTIAILREENYFSVGGVAGQVSSGTQGVFNCSNTGTVIGLGMNKNGTSQVGGIVGRLINNSTVINCINAGAVIGKGMNVGGIVGASSSIISQCTNTGAVTCNGKYVGGITGYSELTISQCTNTGMVTGNENFVGGIAGLIFGTVEKCINSGTVKQTGGVEGLGGIVGETGMNCTAKILNCYNIGTVIEEGNNITGIGGVLGYVSATGASGEISHNYSIGEIQIKGTSATNVGGAIGRYTTTTFVVKNNYYEKNKCNVTLNTLGEGLTATEMKTQEFLNNLNLNQNPTVWEYRSGENNGYPVIKGLTE